MTNKEANLSEVITDRQLAEILGVGWKTIQRMARQGEIRGKQVGRAWRFHRDAIRDFLLTK